MDSLKRTAIILELIEGMKEQGSWCGETHIQKCSYFLQEMMAVPMEFDFILYKHGPFSFDLRDELTAMRADNLLALHVQPYPYGPSLLPGAAAEIVMKRYPKTRAKYKRQIDFVVKTFALKEVAELERLATAFYIYCPCCGGIAKRLDVSPEPGYGDPGNYLQAEALYNNTLKI